MRFSSSSQLMRGARAFRFFFGGPPSCAAAWPYDSTSKRTRRSTSRAPRMAW
jgi:hypothetical protein